MSIIFAIIVIKLDKFSINYIAIDIFINIYYNYYGKNPTNSSKNYCCHEKSATIQIICIRFEENL